MIDSDGDIESGLFARDSASVIVRGDPFVNVMRTYDFSTSTIEGIAVYGIFTHGHSTVTMNGGGTGYQVVADDSSSFTMNDGSVGTNLVADGFSTVSFTGGTVHGRLRSQSSGTATMTGGRVEGQLWAMGSGLTEIVGLDFEVDGVPVPYGDLTATTGTLTGVLAQGDALNNAFFQGDATCGTQTCTGTIRLIEAPDEDADLVPDNADNCPTIPNGPNEDNQADEDGDDVGDVCDNCVEDYNPRATYPAYRTTSGGQLDDDWDGYGNVCDCVGPPGPVCTALHTVWYKTAINKPVTGTNCGTLGTYPCDQFDYDEKSPVITALDTIRYKQLLNQPVGPKCPSCPLECVGDACP
jgi:hypothetical protein